MPGPSNASNRFGPSSYCVGPTLGDGVNFTDIQAAITQAVADGFDASNPCTILVRPGFYSSFTMAPGINVEGVTAGSVFSNYAAVIGNITIDSTTAGGVLYSLKNLQISDPVTGIIIQGVGPTIIVDVANCSINATTGVDVGNTSGTLSQIAFRECRIVGSTTGLNAQLHNSIFLLNTQVQGGTALLLSGDARVRCFNCVFDATVDYGANITGTVNRLRMEYCNISSPHEAILGVNAGETVNIEHCTFDSAAPSGYYIDNVSIYEFYDLALIGTALINNSILTNFIDWQPHAGTAAVGTLPGGVRGTACFDSADFTVTDGFVEVANSVSGPITQLNGDTGNATPVAGVVQILGGPGVTTDGAGSAMTISSVLWTDVALPGVLNVDSGYFDIGPNTYTLPAAPTQGEQFRIYSINSPTVVQANVGQTIQVASSTSSMGGTATGTNTGDCLVLIYYAAGSRWCAESVVGNWILA